MLTGCAVGHSAGAAVAVKLDAAAGLFRTQVATGVNAAAMARAVLHAAYRGCLSGDLAGGPAAGASDAGLARACFLQMAAVGCCGLDDQAARRLVVRAIRAAPPSWRLWPATANCMLALGEAPDRRVRVGSRMLDTTAAEAWAEWRADGKVRRLFRNRKGGFFEVSGEPGSRPVVFSSPQSWHASLPDAGAVEPLASGRRQINVRLESVLLEAVRMAARSVGLSAGEWLALVLDEEWPLPVGMPPPARNSAATKVLLAESRLASLDARARVGGKTRGALIAGIVSAVFAD